MQEEQDIEQVQDGGLVVTDKVLTLPNVVTFLRLLLLPLFLLLEFGAHNEIAALVVYAIAASTDWVDGQIARRTNQVSKLGKLFDPAVDRLLIAVGVIAIVIMGRLPIWILVYVIARDLFLLIAGRIMLSSFDEVPPVRYLGKFATAFIMVGFSFLLLGMPYVPGLGIEGCPDWLPGFGTGEYLLGIWFVYPGLICSVSVFIRYCIDGYRLLKKHKG